MDGSERRRHALVFDVRDYECDLQGIVNNAHYQHYLEHARHVCLRENGLDFATLAAAGVLLVVYRVEIDYKAPLRSGDAFEVSSAFERVSKLRWCAVQDIARLPDRAPIASARVYVTSMRPDGRPFLPRHVEAQLARLAGLSGG